ncbi:alkaline phosphatase family protein [Cupriavidus basilensis]
MGYFKGDVPFRVRAGQCLYGGGCLPRIVSRQHQYNRCFLWSGTNDPLGKGNGPAIGNAYNKLGGGKPDGGYAWTTYPERLEAAGVNWQIYQDMADNSRSMPPSGSRPTGMPIAACRGAQAALRDKALGTRNLDLLRQDVLEGRLPQVSWICPTRQELRASSPSSPAQGAAYVSPCSTR